MKTTSLIVIATSLGLLGAACAQPEGKGQDRPEKRKMPAEVLAKFDADGDGKLNETERAAAKAAREEMKAKMLEKIRHRQGWRK